MAPACPLGEASGSAHLQSRLSGEKVVIYYVYILFSEKDKKFYIGYSSDLKNRALAHLNGKVMTTKNRLPLKLVYYEAFIDKKAARKQELFYKTGQGRRVLKKRLNFLYSIGEFA